MGIGLELNLGFAEATEAAVLRTIRATECASHSGFEEERFAASVVLVVEVGGGRSCWIEIGHRCSRCRTHA